MASLLLSAPALNKTREFTNADGTTFMAKAQGNHHLNWIKTQDGEILKYNKKSKNFEYAQIKDSSLRTSGVRYKKNNSKRARSRGDIENITDAQLHKLLQERKNIAYRRKLN